MSRLLDKLLGESSQATQPLSCPAIPPQGLYNQNQSVNTAQNDHIRNQLSGMPQHLQQSHVTTPHRFQISKHSLDSIDTGKAIYDISQPSKMSSLSLSGKATTVITRSDTKTTLGTVKVNSLSTSIALVINGRETSMTTQSNDFTGEGNMVFPSALAPQGKFYWFRKIHAFADEETLSMRDAMKGGNTIAVVEKNELTITIPMANQMLLDEVIVSAIGMTEMLKKDAKDAKIVLKLLGDITN